MYQNGASEQMCLLKMSVMCTLYTYEKPGDIASLPKKGLNMINLTFNFNFDLKE